MHLHLGANVLLAALVSGALEGTAALIHALALLAACLSLGFYAARCRRFAYLLYAFGAFTLVALVAGGALAGLVLQPGEFAAGALLLLASPVLAFGIAPCLPRPIWQFAW